MSDPIRDLTDRLARVERELHALSTAPRANKTSVQDGFTRWLPAEGETPRVYIGGVGTGDIALWVTDENNNDAIFIGSSGGEGGIFVDETGSLNCLNPDLTAWALLTNNGRLVTPLIASAWQPGTNVNVDAQGRPTTTSASYVPLWQTVLPVTTDQVTTFVDVYPGVGNTADVRITATRFNSGDPYEVVHEETGMTTTDGFFGPWPVPDVVVPGASAIGNRVEFRIEARRTAGAGAIAVAPRFPIMNDA